MDQLSYDRIVGVLVKKRHTPRESVPDDGDAAKFTFKLPSTRVPEPIMKGVRGWRTADGYLVLRLHYTCDPERATEQWIGETSKGYRGGTDGSDWQREMEIDFGSYAGRPVYAQFDKVHSIGVMRYNPNLPLWRGWDFGYRHPAVVFLQMWPDNTLVFLHEIYPTLDSEKVPGISTADLCKLVQYETDRLFPGSGDPEVSAGVYDFCDPAGNQKKETSDFSSIEILQQHGIYPEWNVVGRKNRVDYARVYVEGKHENGEPRFKINPHCTLAHEAFSAAYRYPEEGQGPSDREMPDVSRSIQEQPYIHIMDAFEYVVACNLEVTTPSMHGFNKHKEQNNDVTDLASAYLGTGTEPDNRLASVPTANRFGNDEYEALLTDLLGEQNLSDAWDLT